MREMIRDAGMLRDEARFAMAFATPLLGLGLVAALWHAVLAFAADPVANSVRGALFGGPFLAMGWTACRYASWRLEQAMAAEANRTLSLRPLRVLSVHGAALMRRCKQSLPELAARTAKCQQRLRLYLVGEPH